MKNHIAFKFLAIALCACALLASIASAGGILFLVQAGLYEQSPYDMYADSLENSRQFTAEQIAARYAAKTLGNCPEELLDLYYVNQWYFSDSTPFCYTIRDLDGNVLESTYDASADPDAAVHHYFLRPEYPTVLHHETYPKPTQGLDGSLEPTAPSRLDATIPTEAPKETAPVYDSADSDIIYQSHFGWYDEETSTDHIYDLGYRYGPEYQVTLYVSDEPVPQGSDLLWQLVVLLWQYRYPLFGVLAAGLLLFAALTVYLCCAAGRKPGSDEVHPNGLNLLPLDVYTPAVGIAVYVIVILAGHLLGYGYSADVLPAASIGAAMMALLGCLLIVGLLFALAAQLKAGIGFLWRHSVVGFLCTVAWDLLKALYQWLGKRFQWTKTHLPPFASRIGKKCIGLCKSCYTVAKTAAILILGYCAKALRWFGRAVSSLCRKAWRSITRFIGLLPLTWQWLLTAFVMGMLLLIGFLSGSTFLLFLCMGCCAAIVLYGAHAFGILLESTRRMSKGDLDTKISDQMLVGGFKDFASHLNALAGVAVVAAQKQMKSERMKAELVTNVSHDIKTPLTSIINYVDLLQKASTPEESQQYLEVLSRQSQRMKKLIEDLMEMSKATTGNLHVEITQVDAAEAINQALGEFADKLAAVQLTPVFHPPAEPVRMEADGRLAWRVLSNLLSNAVKYALPGTRLYIDLVTLEGQVLISLKNISREQLNVNSDELMERFVRGDASRNTEGSGLGLNIARSLMELQRGQLQLLIDGDLFKATLIFPAADT